MNDGIEFSKHASYLLARISDTVITFQRAQEILKQIGNECSNLKYTKVLLDERTVERREVPSHEIMKLRRDVPKQGHDKVYMAFWCQRKLINNDSRLLSVFTFKNEYIIQHFSGKEEAIEWLDQQSS